ncbi:MAG: hypothetical protein QME45_04105 [Clostridiales bacterium]|nr:hypothetical protein [Clostridiales bacterium]HBM81187.1 hypothetical protein [Clostridiaceae bacterium]
MEKELIIAILSCAASLFLFLGIINVLKHQIYFENIPGWINAIIAIIVVFILINKRKFFFGTLPVTGAVVGFVLSILWNIRDSIFMHGLIKLVFSFRFLFFIASILEAIAKKTAIMSFWQSNIKYRTLGFKTFIILLTIIVFASGIVLLLFPDAYLGKKSYGFSMRRKTPLFSRLLGGAIGILLVFAGTALSFLMFSLS